MPVQCSGCGSDCQIEITNIAEKSIHDIECERFSFTVCGICYPAVAALESLEAPDTLTVFTSHLNPSVVQFSSHPDVIPVSSFLSVCTSASTSTTVRTATIKSDSNSSHPNFQSNEKLDQNEVVDQNQTDDRNQIIKACFSTARSWFDSCDSVIIIAGAGMSVESGLKTFRYELSGHTEDSKHLEQNLGEKALGLKSNNCISEVSGPAVINSDSILSCTSSSGTTSNSISSSGSGSGSSSRSLLGGGLSTAEVCYTTRPEKAWYYDASIRRDSLACSPHSGYTILLESLKKQKKDFIVLTSNIDHYFIRAGYPKDSVYETHGSVNLIQCAKHTNKGRCVGTWNWNQIPENKRSLPILDDILMECDITTTPLCPLCSGPSRANISHETDNADDIDQTVKNRQKENIWSWLRKFRNDSDDLIPDKNGAKKIKRPRNGSGHDSIKCEKKSENENKNEKEKEKLSKHQNKNKNPSPRLLIVEIGCGSTVHGLRLESDLLLSSHPDSGVQYSKLIRINPDLEKSGFRPLRHEIERGSSSIIKVDTHDFTVVSTEVTPESTDNTHKSADVNQNSTDVTHKNADVAVLNDDINHSNIWNDSRRIIELKSSAVHAIQNIFEKKEKKY